MCRYHEAAAATDAPNAGVTHHARDSLASDTSARISQFRMDVGTAVVAIRSHMDCANALGQSSVFTRAARHRLLQPSVVAAARHLKHPTHRAHRKVGLARLHELVDLPFRPA